MPITPEQLKKALEKYAEHPDTEYDSYLDSGASCIGPGGSGVGMILDGDFDLVILADCLNEVINV